MIEEVSTSASASSKEVDGSLLSEASGVEVFGRFEGSESEILGLGDQDGSGGTWEVCTIGWRCDVGCVLVCFCFRAEIYLLLVLTFGSDI